MDRNLLASKILLRLADDDRYEHNYEGEKLVKNPNPKGVRDMVTQDYADRFLEKTKGKPPSDEQNRVQQNKQKVQEHKEHKKNKTLQRPSNGLTKPEYNEPGKDVSEAEVKNFVAEFKPAFRETEHWGTDLKKNGAASYSGRLKTPSSLHEKMQGRFHNRTLDSVGDIVGVRAVCNTVQDQKKLIDHIYKNFDIIEHDDSVDTDIRPEGYRAHHFTIRSKDGKLIEFQVKTKNQQLFSGFTHDTVYKPPKHLPQSVKDEITKGDDVKKYTKALSDYLYDVDSGKEVGEPPVPPKVLTDNGIKFNPRHIYKHNQKPKITPKSGIQKNDHKALFKINEKTQSIPASQIVARKSPPDAIARSQQYAEGTIKGKVEKRDPLTVWKVKKPDGGYYYSLRDGNTTYHMLKDNFKWDKFPVNVEKEVDEHDLPPVPEHVRDH